MWLTEKQFGQKEHHNQLSLQVCFLVRVILLLIESLLGVKLTGLAALKIHPNGKFLYVSNRFHDSISTFSINQENGDVSLISNVSCEGKTPRDICISPNGAFLAAANQDSSNLAVFEIRNDGCLKFTGQKFPCLSPACIKFLNE